MNDDELARIRNRENRFRVPDLQPAAARASALHNVELPPHLRGDPREPSGRSRTVAALHLVELDDRMDHTVRTSCPAGSASVSRIAPRPREQSLDPARGRADRQPRHQDRHRDHGGLRRAAPGRQHDPPDHPRRPRWRAYRAPGDSTSGTGGFESGMSGLRGCRPRRPRAPVGGPPARSRISGSPDTPRRRRAARVGDSRRPWRAPRPRR